MRLYLRLVGGYRLRDRVILQTVDRWYREENFVRDRLNMVAMQASLPDMHVARTCLGCEYWANYIKPTPRWIDPHVWLTKRGGAVTSAAGITTMPTTMGPVIRPMLPVGAAGHCLGIDGQYHCLRSKAERLQERRARAAESTMARMLNNSDEDARVVASLLRNSTSATTAGNNNGNQVDEEAAAAAEGTTPPLDDDAEDGVDADDDDDDAALEEDLLTGLGHGDDDVGVAIDGNDDDAGNEPDELRRRRPSGYTDQQLQQQRRVVRSACSRFYAQIMQPAMVDNVNCQKTSLLGVDLLGLWYIHDRHVYGRCVWCGDMTEVTANSMTTYGLSCMYHPHPGEFPDDHPHSLLFAENLGSAAAAASVVRKGAAARSYVHAWAERGVCPQFVVYQANTPPRITSMLLCFSTPPSPSFRCAIPNWLATARTQWRPVPFAIVAMRTSCCASLTSVRYVS